MNHKLDVCFNIRDFNLNGKPKSVLTLPYSVVKITHEIDKTPIYFKKNIELPTWEEHFNRSHRYIPLNIYGFSLFNKIHFNQTGFITKEDCFVLKDRDKLNLEFFDTYLFSFNSGEEYTSIYIESTRFQSTQVYYLNEEIQNIESCNDDTNYMKCNWYYRTRDNLAKARAIVIYEKLFDSTEPELETIIYFIFLNEKNVNVFYYLPNSEELYWEDLVFDECGFLNSIKTYYQKCKLNSESEDLENLFSEIEKVERIRNNQMRDLSFEYRCFDSFGNWTELLIKHIEWVDFASYGEIYKEGMGIIERQIEYFNSEYTCC